MKSKLSVILLFAGIAMLGLGMWAYYSRKGVLDLHDLLTYGVLTLVVVFAVFAGLRRLISEKRGEPGEDEFSKRITQKAAATSFYISLYFWLIMSYFYSGEGSTFESGIGIGIVCMALIFALSWTYYRLRGLKD